MLPLFPIRPRIISVHIPRTGGSSFHAFLKARYGFYLKHIHRLEERRCLNHGERFRTWKPCVRALHGHIEVQKVWKEQYPEAQWVTWLRNPADRVISAYYHWQLDRDHRDERHRLFRECQPDLLDFATMPEFAPTVFAYRTFLGEANPEDFAFVGRTEHYEESLRQLCSLMNWKMGEVPGLNANPAKKQVETHERETLKHALKEEYEIYEAFLCEFKAQRGSH